ncbi:MAG TPA: glycosyltransferase, exosortase A system-associated, partial [Pseudomonadales bacterium]|nr:glycosyltransferase, exosortase A system-associated [Pseudomonadales bacterium]
AEAIARGLQGEAHVLLVIDEAGNVVATRLEQSSGHAILDEAALRAGRRHRLPVVYECRAFWEDAAVDHGTSREWGVRYRLTRLMESWVFRRADAITTICAGLRDEIIGRGIAAGKITVIPNAVDLAQFGSADEPDAALQAQLGLTGQRVLGFVGSFYGYEGLDLAVAALAQIGDPAVKLLLVGGGPQEQALRAQVERLGLGQRVIFTGRVPHQEVNRYYSLIDLLLYPRHSMRLTDLVTPLKPLEAMAQQKLLLASDVGGHRELIEDGRTGWLFPAGDAAALARRAEQILAQPDEWPKIRAAGRAFVEQERNWPASVARYRDLYARLLTAA